LGGPRARRMMSASGALNFSSFDIVVVVRELGVEVKEHWDIESHI